MSLPDILEVANFARALDTNKINRVILGPPYSQPATLPGGKSIVQPNCDQIIPVIAQMFALGNKAACNIAVSNNNALLASAHQPSPTPVAGPAATAPTSGGSLADISSLSLSNSSDNMFGLHGLLDLLFAVVFELPQALQV